MRRCSFAAGCALFAAMLIGCGDSGSGSSSAPVIEVSGYPMPDRPAASGATYTYDGPDIAAAGSASVWRFTPGAAVDRERLDVISDVLGISSAQLSVTSTGAVDWYATVGEGFVPCPIAVEASGQLSDGELDGGNFAKPVMPPDCAAADAPEAPPADEIEAKAIDLFKQMGIDLSAHSVTMIDNFTVTAHPLLDGLPSPVAYTLGFGLDGELSFASGFLGTPEKLDGFERATIEDAIGLLQAGWYEYGWNTIAMDPSGAGASGESQRAPGVVEGTSLADGVVVAATCPPNVKCSGLPPAAPTGDISITGAQESLLRADSPDGTVWIVPAWTFVDAGGLEYVVPALSAASFRLVIGDFGVGPGRGEPGAVEPPVRMPMPMPVPATVPVDPAQPVDVPAEIDETEAQQLVGLGEDEAIMTAEKLGWQARVVSRDDENIAVTDDFNTNRVNLAVLDGKVVSATVG